MEMETHLVCPTAHTLLDLQGGSLEGDLKIGESATYIAFYAIEQGAADSGKIINTVMATADNIDGSITVSDVSDDGD